MTKNAPSSSSQVKSPCTLVCSIEAQSGYCYGCGRTRDEIAGWLDFSTEKRQQLMDDELPARVAGLERRPRRTTKRGRLALAKSKKAQEANKSESPLLSPPSYQWDETS